MYKFINVFLWENSVVLEHEIEIDQEFITKHNIQDITPKELKLVFEHFYGVDLAGFEGMRKFVIKEPVTKLTIHLKGLDQFRQLQLLKLL
jgi:hypothetical protein